MEPIFSRTFILGGPGGANLLLPQKWNSSNLSESQDSKCLGPSNRAICTPLSQFCSPDFPTFPPSYWEGLLLPQKWNSPNLSESQDSKQGAIKRLLAACWINFVPKIFQLLSFQPGRANLLLPQKLKSTNLSQDCQLQAPKPLCLVHFWSCKNSLFSVLALWGNKNWPPTMKAKKLDDCKNKSGLRACKWSSLNAPGTQTPLSWPFMKLQEFPFLSKKWGNKNWPPSMKV